MVCEALLPGCLEIPATADLCAVPFGDEYVVEAVALAAAAEPAVLGSMRVHGTEGVGHPGVGEAAVEVVLPAAENPVMRGVPRFNDVQVARDDHGAAELGGKARQRPGDSLLERALVLVAALLRAA